MDRRFAVCIDDQQHPNVPLLGSGERTAKENAEWRDALVVITRGELELECVGGESCRFARGSVLCLVGLPLRALRSRGTEPAVLVAVSRR